MEVLEVADSSSDMLAYLLTIQGVESGYSFPYPIMFLIAKVFYAFTPVEVALSFTVALLNGATFLLIYYYMNQYVPNTKHAWGKVFLSCLVLFYAMLFIPQHALPGVPFRYVGVFSPNPFHNATYLAARPFSVLSFFTFVALYEDYKERFDLKKGCAFAISLLLSTMTKPSFTIVFCGAVGLRLLFDLCKSRFCIWKRSFFVGAMFIPTFLDLLYQYSGVFTGIDSTGEEAGIGIGFLTAWGEICTNVPLAIILPIAFPIVVLLFHATDIKSNKLYRLAWEVYGMGLLMFMVLYEKGFRIYHMNFSWGYMIGMFLLVVVSVMLLLKDTYQHKIGIRLLIQWGIFMLHLACGILYFISILRGESYY